MKAQLKSDERKILNKIHRWLSVIGSSRRYDFWFIYDMYTAEAVSWEGGWEIYNPEVGVQKEMFRDEYSILYPGGQLIDNYPDYHTEQRAKR